MVKKVFTPDYLDDTLNSGASYLYTDTVTVEDANQIGIYVINTGAAQAILHKIQVSNVSVPSVDADWSDFVQEASLANAASITYEYPNGLAVKHVRCGYKLSTSTEPLTIAIGTKRDVY